MGEIQMETITKALGGTALDLGGAINLVRIQRAYGYLVVISDETACEYENEEAFEENRPANSILLR